MSVSAEETKRYFQETAIALRREGFKVEPSVGGRLAVWLDDHPLCEVDQIGGITYRSDNIPPGVCGSKGQSIPHRLQYCRVYEADGAGPSPEGQRPTGQIQSVG